jgi:DNA polymerase III delta prime subunit
MRIATIVDALHLLTPGASWEYNFDTEELTWFSEDIDQPTQEELQDEIIKLQEEYRIEHEAEEQKKTEANLVRQSAIQKLSVLGLTEEEAKAIIGL